MSSINFNHSALVALDTLKGINSNLGTIQSQISTGKSVGSAKDNAAIWAISKVMESDVGGFAKINESLNLGSSSVAVARAGAEQIEGLLEDMKGLIISSQEEGQDQDKIQTDIDRLKDQISAVTNAAQFNGVNLLKAGSDISILSSLDRSSTGVSTSTISVSRNDLTTASQFVDDAGGTTALDVVGTSRTLNDTLQTATTTIDEAVAGKAYGFYFNATDADSSTFDASDWDLGSTGAVGTVAYVAREGDTAADIAAGMAAAFASFVAENGLDTDILNITNEPGSADLTLTSAVTTATDTIQIEIDTVISDDNVSAGGLAGIDSLDVTTTEGATAALATIETAIQAAVDAAAVFGSAEKRIDNQMEFVGALMDSMKAGISALTDTNMEEASARLQSLQVQQQLGVQALSIANGSSQTILSLFRG